MVCGMSYKAEGMINGLRYVLSDSSLDQWY